MLKVNLTLNGRLLPVSIDELKARIDDMKKTRFTLDGKKVFTAEDLGGLRIELEPQQIRILHITRT